MRQVSFLGKAAWKTLCDTMPCEDIVRRPYPQPHQEGGFWGKAVSTENSVWDAGTRGSWQEPVWRAEVGSGSRGDLTLTCSFPGVV